MNEKVVINWSEPIELFKPGIYNTDEKFIEHLRKFVLENENPSKQKSGKQIIIYNKGSFSPLNQIYGLQEE